MMLTNSFMTRMGQAAAKGNPRSGYAEMFPGIASYNKEETEKYLNFAANDPACIEMLPKMYETGTGICVYPEGWKAFEKEFDLWKQPIPFGDIKVPALIVHGDKDCDVPLPQGQQAA